LTCISLWYICIPNITWIHPTIHEKMNGNCHYQACDGRRIGRTLPYHNTSRFRQAYKNGFSYCGPTWPSGTMISINLILHYIRKLSCILMMGNRTKNNNRSSE
jgi:hypothetical protein